MGAESQMLQFAKEDLNLKRKLLEQLEKSDTDFNQKHREGWMDVLWILLVT